MDPLPPASLREAVHNLANVINIVTVNVAVLDDIVTGKTQREAVDEMKIALERLPEIMARLRKSADAHDPR